MHKERKEREEKRRWHLSPFLSAKFLSAFMVLLDQQESYLLYLSSLGVGGVSVTCIPSVLTNI